jgi:hypothetical protein
MPPTSALTADRVVQTPRALLQALAAIPGVTATALMLDGTFGACAT